MPARRAGVSCPDKWRDKLRPLPCPGTEKRPAVPMGPPVCVLAPDGGLDRTSSVSPAPSPFQITVEESLARRADRSEGTDLTQIFPL